MENEIPDSMGTFVKPLNSIGGKTGQGSHRVSWGEGK
jgi:hypothetical protein